MGYTNRGNLPQSNVIVFMKINKKEEEDIAVKSI